ncbi:hypothetical protein BG006_001066 [Podila minutissima]|uniref:VPS9 domain-containing protein n=1 Tax=Podila minutissima TaxID=64525 RepID=A0A9P5SXH2_9FUNG|nr:hypothetical protein BG006_001066 [Podila minutissima]
MAQGTQAYSMLKRIQEHPIELADIIRLLVTKKAILALPTCPYSSEEQPPPRAYFEDHVIIPESNHGESLFVTLSGVRGILRPASSSIQILGMASGHDFTTIATDASGPTKRSFFDNISKTENASELTAGGAEFKLVNSSKRPVVIFVESVGSVQALLLDKSFTRPGEAPTPIVPLTTGIARELSIGAARRTAGSSSPNFSAAPVNDRDPLPKLPKIASDLPLEWDSVVRDLESFVIKLRRSPLPNADRYANEFQRKYDDVRQRFEVYGSASGLGHRWSDHDFDEMQRWIETWLCREMYNTIFSQPNSEDYLHDEQLQAKIAALNFLDLTLEHLGFALEHPEDVEHIAQVVREGGLEMQKLGSVISPSDKMNVILSCHRVVVDTLNREPAVQEMLAGVESFKGEDTSDTTPSATETNTSQAQHMPSTKDASSLTTSKSSLKRLSMPRIPMDGAIPSQDSHLAAMHVHSPRIPMDEGYKRPSMRIEKIATDVEEPTEDKDTKVEGKEQNVKVNEHTSDENAINNSNGAKSPVIDIEPSEAPLPDSPVIDTAFETPDVLPSLVVSSSTRKQYSADVLIPLLIFSVVKSNPPMLISNLRYIQRFKVQDHLTGELAYCLTNMMAVVSFLETLDPQALGLSSDIQVLSDTSDIRLHQGKTPPTPLINLQDGLDQTKALGHKVGQEIVGVAEEGLKVISDVVQDGYSKFFGRFLTSTDSLNSRGNPSHGNRPVSASSSLAATAAADAAAAARLSTEDTRTEAQIAALVTPAVLTSNVTTLSVNSPAGTESSAAPAAKKHLLTFIRNTEGPQIQYMACTNADDLRLSDVKRKGRTFYYKTISELARC